MKGLIKTDIEKVKIKSMLKTKEDKLIAMIEL